jgi:TonB family protein
VALASAGCFFACGGAAPPESKAPTTGDDAGAAVPSASAEPVAAATTTTTALPDAGELQGAKLGSSTHTEVETKGPSGPHAGAGHTQEPGRSRNDIQAVVMAHRDEARACYDKGSKTRPGLEGNLTVQFRIDPTGKVTDTQVDAMKSAIHDDGIERCIMSVIKRLSFAASKGGFETRASYPFDFHPVAIGKTDAGTTQ